MLVKEQGKQGVKIDSKSTSLKEEGSEGKKQTTKVR